MAILVDLTIDVVATARGIAAQFITSVDRK